MVKCVGRYLGLCRDYAKISLGRPIRLAAALLPVAQRPERNTVTGGEFLLGEAKRAHGQDIKRKAKAEK